MKKKVCYLTYYEKPDVIGYPPYTSMWNWSYSIWIEIEDDKTSYNNSLKATSLPDRESGQGVNEREAP